MLGWYGLQESERSGSCADAGCPANSPHAHSNAESPQPAGTKETLEDLDGDAETGSWSAKSSSGRQHADEGRLYTLLLTFRFSASKIVGCVLYVTICVQMKNDMSRKREMNEIIYI